MRWLHITTPGSRSPRWCFRGSACPAALSPASSLVPAVWVSPGRSEVVHKGLGELLSLTLNAPLGIIPSVYLAAVSNAMVHSVIFFPLLKKQKAFSLCEPVIAARRFTAFSKPPPSPEDARQQFPRSLRWRQLPSARRCPGQVRWWRGGKESCQACEWSPACKRSLARPSAPCGSWGAGPKVLLSQRGRCLGWPAGRVPERGSAGQWGGLRPPGRPGWAGGATHPPGPMAALRPGPLWDRGVVRGRALRCLAANGRAVETVAANRSMGLPWWAQRPWLSWGLLEQEVLRRWALRRERCEGGGPGVAWSTGPGEMEAGGLVVAEVSCWRGIAVQ